MRLQARIAALMAICALIGPLLQSADKTFTVALVPDGLTQDEREPLRNYLTKAMGHPVKIVVPDRYAETVAHLEDGSFDFACLGALMYVKSHAKDGVVPLVQRSADLQFHTVFITGADSSVHSLADLKGKRFAFGDINSASGHLIPYRELKEAGINPDTDLKTQFSGAHTVTAAFVETGAVDAGALDETVFSSMVASGKINSSKVRVFHTSKPFVDYVFVSRKAVPEAERERFARALLDLKEGENDAVLKILRAKKFVTANDPEYETIRQIAKQLNLY